MAVAPPELVRSSAMLERIFAQAMDGNGRATLVPLLSLMATHMGLRNLTSAAFLSIKCVAANSPVIRGLNTSDQIEEWGNLCEELYAANPTAIMLSTPQVRRAAHAPT